VVHSAQVGLVVHVVQAVLVVHSAKAGLIIHVVQAVLVVHSAKADSTKPALAECTTKTA
jgi:hypothetical protein